MSDEAGKFAGNPYFRREGAIRAAAIAIPIVVVLLAIVFAPWLS
jgi:hypothetical protein